MHLGSSHSVAATCEEDRMGRRMSRRLALQASVAAAGVFAFSVDDARALTPTPTWGRVNGKLFRRNLYSLSVPPAENLPYNLPTSTPLARDVDYIDENGVTRTMVNGALHYNPVSIAQYSLERLNSFRLLGDRVHLQAAMANVNYLIGMAKPFREALYLPYDY